MAKNSRAQKKCGEKKLEKENKWIRFLLGKTEQDVFEEVLHGDIDFSSEPWPSISNSAKDLVKQMLVRDLRRRLTAHEVLCGAFPCGLSSMLEELLKSHM